jgi:dCTP deaminase
MLPRGTFEIGSLTSLFASGALHGPAPVPGQIQPASIDLRLAAEAFRMPGSVLPVSGERVRDLVAGLALECIDLSRPTCLARGGVYLVRLQEEFALPEGVEAYANGKSSTGRVDLATRVLADGCPRYDRIPAGYHGELWLELIPRSFDIVAQAGVTLNQVIVFQGRQVLGQVELAARHRAEPLLFLPDGTPAPASHLFDGRLMMGADLDRDIVGWVAKRTHKPLVLSAIGQHDARDFFEPVTRPTGGFLYLAQDRFYILVTRERVAVPADLACEMVPYDPTAGDFRAHYAGFFDPGWGIRQGRTVGAPAVLEVRPHTDDLILRHGQPICAMAYETLSAPCVQLYGDCGNTYATQDGPRLSKHFRS